MRHSSGCFASDIELFGLKACSKLTVRTYSRVLAGGLEHAIYLILGIGWPAQALHFPEFHFGVMEDLG